MRKPIATLLLLSFIAFWIWIAGTVGSALTDAPQFLQLIFYIVAGLGWILPLRPLFKWMNANETNTQE